MRASRAADRVPDLLERWAADGLVTADQARRMRADLAAATADPRRTVAVAEALAYVGAALVVVALILVGSWYWADLGLPAKLGVAGAAAVALGVAGAVVPAGRSAVEGRLRAVLWLAATAATGGFLALAGDGAGWSEEVVAAVATVGGLVWVAVLMRDLVVLVVASAGTVIVVPAIAGRFFPGTLGVALALLVVGVLTVAAAIATLRRAPLAAPVRQPHDGAVPRRGEEER
jgi:hypothetical protein